MPTTPNGLRYPVLSEAPNGPLQIANLAADADTKVIGRFPSAAARDTAIPNPATDQRVTVAGQPQIYRNGRWGREGDIPKPHIRLLSSQNNVPGNGTLHGIGPNNLVALTVRNGMDAYVTQRQDGLNVQPGVYAVTYNITITAGGSTTARSLLDIVGDANTSVLSRAPMTWPGEANGTNSANLFLPSAQQVRFLMYLQASGSPLTVVSNVDMMRLGDF